MEHRTATVSLFAWVVEFGQSRIDGPFEEHRSDRELIAQFSSLALAKAYVAAARLKNFKVWGELYPFRKSSLLNCYSECEIVGYAADVPLDPEI